MKNPAAGGGHWVDVAPGRFASWMAEFARRHGGMDPGIRDEAGAFVTFAAADGAVAECHAPFPPVSGSSPEEIAEHAAADRTVAVLLVRLGGYAAGVFRGSPPRLVASKTGSRLVHGRSAAGGWSQHRFARRREKQVNEALSAAAAAAVGLFSAQAGAADALVLGGDKRAIADISDDVRLAPYLAKAVDRFLTVPDPRLAVLTDTPRTFTAIRIRLTEPDLTEPAQPETE